MSPINFGIIIKRHRTLIKLSDAAQAKFNQFIVHACVCCKTCLVIISLIGNFTPHFMHIKFHFIH